MLSKKEKIRLVFGVIIVALIFAFIGVSSYVENHSEDSSILNYSEKYKHTLPSNFDSEIFDINGLSISNLLTKDDEKVIGFSLNCTAQESFKLIKSKLELNNWKFAESGSQTAGSFYKDEGEVTWLFLNCIDVGGGSSVVITCN